MASALFVVCVLSVACLAARTEAETTASQAPTLPHVGPSLHDALEAALARRRWRRRGFRIDGVECAGEDVCVLRLHSASPKPKKTSGDFDVKRESGMCRNDDSESEETGCCESLMDQINSLYRESFPQNILEILREAKCSKLYCRRKDCEFIGCAVPDCEATSPTHSSTSDLSTSRTHSTGHPAAVTDDDDGPNVTVIVVSCLLAFLAGVGGAVLITCLLKRRRVAKASGDVPQSFSSTTFMTGKEGDETFYEELPDGSASGQKTGSKSSGARLSSENEYTYIPEQVTATPPHHGTTENPASSTYNVPGDHLANRKLPCAPAPRAEQPALATRPGGQRMETATNLPAGSYALATQPDKEASSAEKTPKSDAQYFILEEEENSSAGSAPASLREGTAQSSLPASQSGALYSPLTRDARGGQEGEYTALGKDTAGARDYLELLPEYSLQKPLD